jgi:isocitrate dehydrogenase (NAD+)
VTHHVALIPGEGIGPEVIAAARGVVDATGVAIEWDVQIAGAAAFEREGTALPDRVVESVRQRGVALKGPLDTANRHGYRSPSIALRRALDLHTTVRPCRAPAGIAVPAPDADLVVVKMNHEDTYAGIEFARSSAAADRLRELIVAEGGPALASDTGFSLKPISAGEARRVIAAAFDYARTHGRRRVTAVHKASLMRESDGVFLATAREVAAMCPEVEFDDALVDAVCEQLVTRASGYDVMVMPRMYGDILSGIAAAVTGGLGVSPGVNLGPGCAVFEAAHGTAPRLAGRDVANPTAAILSGVMLLRRLGEEEAAARLDDAVADVIADGTALTYDLRPGRQPAGAASTSEFADAVVTALES